MKAICGACLLAIFVLTSGAQGLADSQLEANVLGLKRGHYSVGFQLLETLDHSRSLVGRNPPSSAHPRPVRIYFWYPASPANDERPMTFGEYAALADEDIWPEAIAGDLRKSLPYSRRALARSLDADDYEALLQRPVLAIENARPLAGAFPLIVMGQGLYYESPAAFASVAEYLTGRGFVVATCPLAGTHSPIVRMNVPDLETQVRDLEFVIARMRQESFVSPDRLGVFGFDMGGMAGLILNMRNPGVDAFVSVSSGILYPHPSGIPGASPHYDPLALQAAWLHSVPKSWIQDMPSLFDAAIHSERYMLLTEDMGHVDYTGYVLVESRKPMNGYWGPPRAGAIDRHQAVVHYIARFFAAFLKGDAEARQSLSEEPAAVISGPKMVLEHRGAEPVTMTHARLVQAVLAGEAAGAVGKLRSLRNPQPDHPLLQETYLERLVWSLRDTWGLTEQVMPLIRFRAESFPESAAAQQMLAEGHIALGDIATATEIYRRLVEENPDNRYFRSRLQGLSDQ